MYNKSIETYHAQKRRENMMNLKNFAIVEETERTLRLDPKGFGDEIRCFNEVGEILDKYDYDWVEFCFNGRTHHLTKENYQQAKENYLEMLKQITSQYA